MRNSLRFTSWLALLLVLAMTACGTTNVGSLNAGQLDDQRQTAGVTLGGYEVVRLNADGNRDSALNPTLDLRLEKENGGNVLIIGVNDVSPQTVALDIKYDGKRVHPERSEFCGLLGGDDQIIGAAFLTQTYGVAGIGQTCVNDYRPGKVEGDFAKIYFADGPCRITSAGKAPKQAINVTVGGLPNMVLTQPTPTPTSANITWYAGFNKADGDQNMLVNLADITPIGFYFKATWDLTATPHDWNCLTADYDGNKLIALSDITPVGQNFGNTCPSFKVEWSDDVAGAAVTARPDITWGSATAKDGAAADGTLVKVFKYWSYDITGADYTTLSGLDTAGNANGKVWVTITPTDGTNLGEPTQIEVLAGTVIPPYKEIAITGFDIQVGGATGGTGAGSDIFSSTGDASGNVVANQAITNMRLNSISGTFDGVAFTPTTLPAGMTQAMYDAAINWARPRVAWTISHGGRPEERHTTVWYVPTAPYTGNGDPGAGVVFPDDDPASTGANAQGTLGTSLATGTMTNDPMEIRVSVESLINYANYTFVVAPDTTAPRVINYYEDPGWATPITQLTVGAPTKMFIEVDWGGATPTYDANNVALELMHIDPLTLTPFASDTVALAFTSQKDPGLNQFHIEDTGPGSYMFAVNISGGTISTDGRYLLRLGKGLQTARTWGSINKPNSELPGTDNGMLTTVPAPPPTDLITDPRPALEANVGTAGTTYLTIMFPEPIIRREGAVVYINDEMDPPIRVDPVNAIGYADILKMEDETATPMPQEFLCNFDSSTNPKMFPIVRFYKILTVGGTIPADLTDPADPRWESGANYAYIDRRPNRLVIDVASLLTDVFGPEDPDHFEYVFRVYDAESQVVGQGSFNEIAVLAHPPSITGVSYGMNLWNRENFLVSARGTHWGNTTINADTIDDAVNQPDVLWVEFSGGDFPDPNAVGVSSNVRLVVTDPMDNSRQMPLDLTVVGVGATGNYIAMHPLNRKTVPPVGTAYFTDWVTATGGGVLDIGQQYTVSLLDPHDPTQPYVFGTQMDVNGTTSPNF